MSNFNQNEIQQYLDQCPRTYESVVAQDCPINWGDIARFFVMPTSFAVSENPFSGVDEASQLVALGTEANWQAAFDTPVTAEAKMFASPSQPFDIKAQDNPVVLPTTGNYANGQPFATAARVYEIITFNLYNLAQENEEALFKLNGKGGGVLFSDILSNVIGQKPSTPSSATDTFFFKSDMIIVSSRQKVQSVNAEGDLIQVQMYFELGELTRWRKYAEAAAFVNTILPTS